ncbi:TetR/AcrR family transcriptional regulator [Staphylococcus aureus]
MTIDRRIRKSQVAMRNAFIELLHQHQLEEITVQQIADLADVNRSTFYTHYYDKYDLLEKLEDQQLEEIRDFIHDEKLNGAVKLSTDNIHQINGIPFSYFMSYVSGAGLSLIRHWVEDPNRIDKVDLIRHFNTIVNQGPATIIKNI